MGPKYGHERIEARTWSMWVKKSLTCLGRADMFRDRKRDNWREIYTKGLLPAENCATKIVKLIWVMELKRIKNLSKWRFVIVT